MKRCKYGKLKHKVGKRVCKKARASKRARRGAKRSRRSYKKAAGLSLGLVGVMAIGAVGAFQYWKSQDPAPA